MVPYYKTEAVVRFPCLSQMPLCINEGKNPNFDKYFILMLEEISGNSPYGLAQYSVQATFSIYFLFFPGGYHIVFCKLLGLSCQMNIWVRQMGYRWLVNVAEIRLRSQPRCQMSSVLLTWVLLLPAVSPMCIPGEGESGPLQSAVLAVSQLLPLEQVQ